MHGLRRKDNAQNEAGKKDRENYGDTGEQKALHFKGGWSLLPAEKRAFQSN